MQRTPPPKDVADAMKAQAAKGETPEAGGAAAPHPGKPGPGKPGAGKPGPAKGGKSGKPGAAAEPHATPAAPVKSEADDWGSLQVLGSFVLAAAVLGHLLLSGRATR